MNKNNNRAAETWSPAINLFAEFSAPPFEVGTVPRELGEHARLFSKQSGIDVSVPLVSAVTTAAAAIPDQIQVCADSRTKWHAQPRLWTLHVGSPGCGKTPGQRSATRALWSIHSEINNRWCMETKGLSAEEARKVPRPRAIVGDATMESLTDVLADNERGVAVITEELDSWLGSMDQYRSGSVGRDRGEWLKAFDGGPHSVERVKRGTMFVPNWGCSILSATTPAAMRRFARHLPEDGLIQRFMVVHVKRRECGIDVEEDLIAAADTQYTETIRRLWALVPRANAGMVNLSPDAKERFKAWQVENAALQEALGSLASPIEGHLAKHPTLALRLALVFHAAFVVNLADSTARDPALHPISLHTLELAIAFLRHVRQHAVAFYVGSNGAPGGAYELARSLARFILAQGGSDKGKALARRDIIARVHEFRKADERVQSAALQLLVDLSWIRVTRKEGQYQKSHPTHFSVNPHLHAKFAGLAEQERARRALAREQIEIAAAARRYEREDAE